jgi:hypothetical protein
LSGEGEWQYGCSGSERKQLKKRRKRSIHGELLLAA